MYLIQIGSTVGGDGNTSFTGVTADVSGSFNTSGTVIVTSGTLYFKVGGAVLPTSSPLIIDGGTVIVDKSLTAYTNLLANIHLKTGQLIIRGDVSVTGSFLMTGGTLTVDGSLTIEAGGSFTINGGVINGVGLTIILGTMNWCGGYISGSSTYRIYGIINIQCTTAKSFDTSRLEVHGTAYWIAGDITSLNGATLYIGPTGRLEITGIYISISIYL